jgi:hypothetical protein
MSAEDTELELFEAGVEGSWFDDDATTGVEVGVGCVVEVEVGAGSDGFP